MLFVFSASKHELEMRKRARSLDGWPLSPLSCDADVGRLLPGHYIISCDNLFYKRRLNSEQKKTTSINMTFSEGHWTTKETQII